MKTAFILTASQRLASALVPSSTLSAICVGMRVDIMRDLVMRPYTVIRAGERGTIDSVDQATGGFEILLDHEHHGLRLWYNHILLEPFGCDDIEDGIALACGRMLIAA